MRTRLIIIVLAFLALGMVVANGFVYHHQIKHYVVREATEDHEQQVEIISDRIDQRLKESLIVTNLISGREEFLRALLNRDVTSVFQANRVLDYFRNTIGADVCYLLDADGITLASSNRYDDTSFVGKNYAFRPYFKQARKGGATVYLAIGATSGKQGIYRSHPIIHPAYGRIEGVVVIKFDVSQIESQLFDKQEAAFVLIDPNGFIFLSNRKEWQRRLLWRLNADTVQAIIRSRQFGKGPFEWTGMRRTGSDTVRDAGGREYYIHERAISEYPGWRLLMVHDIKQDLSGISRPMRQIILYILAPFCLLIILVSLLIISLIREETRSREKYQRQFLLLDALRNDIPDPIVLYNERGEVNYVNPAFEETFGWPFDELAGMRIDFVPEESRQETATALKRLAGDEKITRFITRRLTRNGKLLDVEISASRVSSPDGEKKETVVVFRDITRMKRVVAALRESEEKFRVIGESAQDAIIMMDQNGDVTFWNAAARRIFGYTAEEITGKFLYGIIVPERYRDTFSSAFEQFRESGRGDAVGRVVELVGLHKNGAEIPVDLSLAAVKLKGRWHSIGMVRDISQRKAAEEKIRQYTKDLETIVEDRTRKLRSSLKETENAKNNIDAIMRSLSGGLVVSDIKDRVVMMNRESQDMLNIRFNGSEPLHLPDIIPIRERMKNDKERRGRRNGGRQFDFEAAGRENGQPKILRARMSIIRSPGGITGGVVITLNDVTWEREIDRMKSEFISMAAHELRTPLTSILGFSEILTHREDLPQGEQQKYVRHINEKAVALSGIVSNLIDISQFETGKALELHKETVEIGRFVAEVVEKHRHQNKNRRFELALPPSGLELEVDRNRMVQVLGNIIGNAVKFSSPGEAVCIKVVKLSEECRIVVRDRGIGMTKEQVKQVFRRFYRVDNSDSAREGTGLGMSMVKYLVEAHGGKVRVQSEYGKGTTVTVSMPVGE